MSAIGSVLHAPVPQGDHIPIIYTLVVDRIEWRGGEPAYRFRDDDGPALLIRESRLVKLGLQLEPAPRLSMS